MHKDLAFSVIVNFKSGWVFRLKLFVLVGGSFALHQILKTIVVMNLMKN